MAKSQTVERRKNPSRRRQISFDVAYQVLWNSHRHTFDVYRAEEKTGASARDKATAIGLAVSLAQQEAVDVKVSVSSMQNEKMTIEWSR